MHILIRKHLLPSLVNKKVILDRYLELLDDTGVLQAKWDMDFWIKTKFSYRDSIVKEEVITIEMKEEKTFLDSVKHDTIVQEWLTNKRKDTKQISFKKTRLKTKCSICLLSNGIFISIDPCKCIFHKNCIIEATRYSMLCPLCHTTIKEKNEKTNAETEKKEKKSI